MYDHCALTQIVMFAPKLNRYRSLSNEVTVIMMIILRDDQLSVLAGAAALADAWVAGAKLRWRSTGKGASQLPVSR